MLSALHIGIDQLLTGAVETSRIEFKASWDPKTTGHQVLKTLCAFANDLQNLNGGYIIIGVAEARGVAIRPVEGLSEDEIDAAQKWIRGNCNRIEPTYMPIFDVVAVDGKKLLVLWAPASDARPHQAPDGERGARKYWVRISSESVEAQDQILTDLLRQTARVPFDDRRAHGATNDDLRISLAREFLADVGSDLLHQTDAEAVYAAMQITARQNGHTIPRNIGLLFFSDDPERWFRGARIEVVEFADDAGGDLIDEQVFRGPLPHQLRACLRWLDGMMTRHLEKQPLAAEARSWVSYPNAALREALVNAIYHRSYEESVEPTKVYLYPDRVEIISYPGPVMGIDRAHLAGTLPMPPVPARNRRIGELLKELRLAEARGTGLPKIRRTMRENGSPAPTFDWDDHRSYFRVTLPAHPEYMALNVLRDYAYRKATGDLSGAQRALAHAWAAGQRSPSIALAAVRDHIERRDLEAALALAAALPATQLVEYARVLTTLADALLNEARAQEAVALLDLVPSQLAAPDAFEAAIAERRAGRQDRAHQHFERAGELVLSDVRALHEFAQTKMALTAPLAHSKRAADQQVRRRLLDEAASYLERVLQLEAPAIRHAHAWADLGLVRQWRRQPRQDSIQAFERARALAPDEPRFQRLLDRTR